MKIVNRVRTMFNIYKRFVKCISKCRKYLGKGVYRLNSSLTIVYNTNFIEKEKEANKYLFGKFIEQNTLLTLFIKLFNKKIKKDGDKFAGQLVIISSNERDYKVFDYNTDTLITIFESTSIAEDIYTKRKQWAEHFSVISFERFDTRNIISEKILKNSIVDHNEMYYNIINDYISYLQKDICKYETSKFSNLVYGEQFEKDFGFKNSKAIQILREQTLKKCITHGDLWSSNIIVDDTTYYYIDFENVGMRVFYFDLLMYMFSEELILGDSYLLSHFFEGYFDVEMKAVFDAAEETYLKENKSVYFIVFLYTLYLERWKGKQSFDTTRKVRSIIDKYVR